MKKIILLAAMCLMTLYSQAQDIIFTTTHEHIETWILEITDTEVKYKLWSNLDGPDYSLELSWISHIKFSNGDTYVVPRANNDSNAPQDKEVATDSEWEDDNYEENPTIVLKTGKELPFSIGKSVELINGKFYYGTERLKKKEYKDLVSQICPAAYEDYNRAKVYENVAVALMIPSIAIEAYALYEGVSMLLSDEDNEETTDVQKKIGIELGVSLGVTIIAAIIGMKSVKLFESSCTTFNQTCAWKQPQKPNPELSFSFSAASVGLTLNF